MKLNLAPTLALFGLMTATPIIAAGENHHSSGGCCQSMDSTTSITIANEAASKPAGHEAHADHMLEGYAVVSAALYKDDLEAARKASAGMVKHDKNSAMAKPAQAIADSKTIEEARKHFKDLSDAAIPMAKADKTLHEAHCPMAFDGKGANWLQKSADEVQNPYYGKKMPHCGKMVK